MAKKKSGKKALHATVSLSESNATTKCPVCEEQFAGKKSDEATRLLHEHLRKKHSNEDVNQAAARIVRQTTEN